ncbi:MAG: GNAT family N-acetyltransferase [Lysobacterales bacterium]
MTHAVQPDLAALEFETARLRARRLCADDEPLFCSLYTDPDTMRFIGEPLSIACAARRFREVLALMRVDPPEQWFCALVDHKSNLELGLCGVARIDRMRGRAELGVILQKSARRRGLGREAWAGLVEATLGSLSIREVWAQYAPGHEAFDRIAAGLGFELACSPGSFDSAKGKQIRRMDREMWNLRQFVRNQGKIHV